MDQVTLDKSIEALTSLLAGDKYLSEWSYIIKSGN